MIIIQETNLKTFEFWQGGRENAQYFTENELDATDSALKELYPEGIDERNLNDIFRFEPEFVAGLIGQDREEISMRNAK